MKHITKKLVATTGMMALALPAFAMIEVDANGEAIGNTKTRVGEVRIMNFSENESKINGSVQNQTRVQTNTGLDVTRGVQDNERILDLNANTNINANTDVNTVVPATLETQVSDDATVETGDRSAEENIVLTNANDLEVSANISGFTAEEQAIVRTAVEAMVQNDTDIRSVVVSKNQVSITYDEQVALFGFIDASMERTGTITFMDDNTIEVEVSKAWWSFLASSNLSGRTELEAMIRDNMEEADLMSTESRISALAAIHAAFGGVMIGADGGVTVVGDQDADVENINNELEANTDTNVNVSGSVETRATN